MSYDIKPLDWQRISLRRVRVNGTRKTTETWRADTGVFGGVIYKVYSTVGGRVFMELPRVWRDKGEQVHVSAVKKPVASIEAGRAACAAHWHAACEAVLERSAA